VPKNEIKSNELKKHVGAVHIRNRLSLLQRKVANVLLLNAYENLFDKDVHAISVRHLSEIVGFDSKDIDTLKKSLRRLAETAIEWNLLDNKGKDVWQVSTMLAEAEISDGECRYAYSRMLREKLYNPEVYARINLAIQRRFSSGHALALYENCARFRSTRSTGWWELVLFRKLMGIEDNEYQNFKDFNKRVVKPAIEQINTQSDISIKVEFKREKRRVVGLRFLIEDNPQLSLKLSVKEQLLSSMNEGLVVDSSSTLPPHLPEVNEDGPPVETVDPKSRDMEREKTLYRMKQFGLTDKIAKLSLEQNSLSYIEDNLDIVESNYKAGKVDNLPAYTAAALKNDYRQVPIPLAIDTEAAKREIDATAFAKKNAQEALKRLRTAFYKNRLFNALNQLDEHKRAELEDNFWQTHLRNPLIRKFKNSGLEHPVVNSVFLSFISENLINQQDNPEISVQFAAFVEEQGENLETLQAMVGKEVEN
jgi:hypothetical protein